MRDIAPFGLRIPADLKQKVEEAAKSNKRSINSEILSRINESFVHGDLSTYQDADLVAELMRRYGRGEIYIRIGNIKNEIAE